MSGVWNHRVVKHTDKSGDTYAIHEAHYDEAGAVAGWTENPCRLLANSIEDLRWQLDQMQQALEKPVLTDTFR